MSSLVNQWRRALWRHRATDRPVGRINDTVRLIKSSIGDGAGKQPGRRYGPSVGNRGPWSKPKRESVFVTSHGANVVLVDSPNDPVSPIKPKPARDRFGRFVKRLTGTQ